MTPTVAHLPADQIHTATGDPYLERYHLTYARDRCVRYHHWLGSDHLRALHDHPWDSVTVVLAGHLIEHTPTVTRHLDPGDVITRHASEPHAIELDDTDAWTVFTTGPIIRTWGFHTGTGWVPWRQYPHTGRTLPLPGHVTPDHVTDNPRRDQRHVPNTRTPEKFGGNTGARRHT